MPDPVASQTGNGTKTNDPDELRMSDGTRAGHVKIMQTAVLMLRKEKPIKYILLRVIPRRNLEYKVIQN